MTRKNSRGIIYFAFNNRSIDYWHLASLSALTAKFNLDVPVCLVTGKDDHKHGLNRYGNEYAKSIFDEVVLISNDHEFIDNKKTHHDGRWTNRLLPYKNSMQIECYKYSPFDETILLDTDYLVMSNNLNNCWGSNLDFMANYYTNNLHFNATYEKTFINSRGMNVLWSTCVYFKKSGYMDVFFGLVEYIKEHWQYYYSLYGINSRLYRNDYVFTIAHHIMNGFVDCSEKNHLPIRGMHVLKDTNDIYDMPSKNSLQLLTEVPNEKGNYLVNYLSEIDVHVQNKWAIDRISKRIKQFYV